MPQTWYNNVPQKSVESEARTEVANGSSKPEYELRIKALYKLQGFFTSSNMVFWTTTIYWAEDNVSSASIWMIVPTDSCDVMRSRNLSKCWTSTAPKTSSLHILLCIESWFTYSTVQKKLFKWQSDDLVSLHILIRWPLCCIEYSSDIYLLLII